MEEPILSALRGHHFQVINAINETLAQPKRPLLVCGSIGSGVQEVVAAAFADLTPAEYIGQDENLPIYPTEVLHLYSLPYATQVSGDAVKAAISCIEINYDAFQELRGTDYRVELNRIVRSNNAEDLFPLGETQVVLGNSYPLSPRLIKKIVETGAPNLNDERMRELQSVLVGHEELREPAIFRRVIPSALFAATRARSKSLALIIQEKLLELSIDDLMNWVGAIQAEKLIDFAHTAIKPEEDFRVNKGEDKGKF